MLKSCVLFLMPRAFVVARGFMRVASELSCRVSCGQGVCVPLTGSPQALGHSLGQERELEWLMQRGRHRTEHSAISSNYRHSPNHLSGLSFGSYYLYPRFVR